MQDQLRRITHFAKRSVPISIRPYLIRRLPDRQYLEEVVLPKLGVLDFKDVLFVGIDYYTRHYGKDFMKNGSEFWTIDIRQEVSRFGSAGKHIVGDITEVDRLVRERKFDLVLLNGVFGFGVDKTADQERAICAIKNVMQLKGILLVGWNTDRVDDPRRLESIAALFTPISVGGLPERKQFDDSTHVFDLYIAI